MTTVVAFQDGTHHIYKIKDDETGKWIRASLPAAQKAAEIKCGVDHIDDLTANFDEYMNNTDSPDGKSTARNQVTL